MFDTTCANRCRRESGRTDPETFPAEVPQRSIGVIIWEEHCIECGQPYCFKTCKMYERAFDGKCKRFKNGITPVRGGYRCEFKKWGKLEGAFTGRMWSARCQRVFLLIDRPMSWIVQMINRLLGFVPGRIGAITIYRRLKKWAFDYLPGKKNCQVNGVALNVWADRSVKLHFSIVDKDRNLFDDVIDLKIGWNEWRAVFPAVGKGARFLLFSTEEKEFALIFARLDLILSGDELPLAQKVGTSKDHAKFVKCVAWDLDNTLWNGILVEDGAENLVLNEAAVSLIKELDRRGIVHTVLSKNDAEPALAVLKKFGLEEYFIFPHINWLPKSGNLQSAAKEINIGLDTFAFIDDSAFERGEVGEKCPMVRVFNATEIEGLANRPEFNPPISAESAGRRLSYRREMQRVAAANTYQGDYDEFLRSCKIELKMFDLHTAEDSEYRRCYELIQRTNQLTLAGRRYSEDEFRALVERAGMCAYGIRCTDRFGDYGIVGVILYSTSGDICMIEEFVMSCRVAKKKCEETVVRWVAEKVKGEGSTCLSADIIKTGRNMALVAAFDAISGMSAEVKDDSVHYEMALDSLVVSRGIAKVVEE